MSANERRRTPVDRLDAEVGRERNDGAQDLLATEYESSIVEIILDDAVVVLPANDRPDAAFDGSLWIVTAHNPRGRVLEAEANDARARVLEARVRELGIAWHPATGMSRDRSWQEAGVALTGCSLEAALDLAVEFEQLAIFEASGGNLVVHWTGLAPA